jgi:hypothetical protein
MTTNITLYTHRNTPAAHANAPIIARRGDEWFLVNAFRISPIAAPHSEMIDPINERVMPSATAIKKAVAAAGTSTSNKKAAH